MAEIVELLSIEVWVSISLIYFLAMITQLLIFKNEWQKRKSEEIIFINKIFKIVPFLCIMSGTLVTFSGSFRYFQGPCFVARQFQFLFGTYQLVFMGFFQISRLYYCFSQSKVYSTKGYPNWLIYMLYVLGIIFIINITVFGWFVQPFAQDCGINKQSEFFMTDSDHDVGPISIFWNITSISYLFWDLATLLLCIIKMISFRKYKSEQITVYNRIMSILNRIVILTLLYEISALLMMLSMQILDAFGRNGFIVLQAAAQALFAITQSYSIFLMQQHNTCEYKKFLRWSYKLGVYHICCCCFKSIVKTEIQIDPKETDQPETKTKTKSTDEDKKVDMDETRTECDSSEQPKHVGIADLSVETEMYNMRNKIV